MEHKMIVAQNLREGLRKIKEMYTQAFYKSTPFTDQWQCFVLQESADVEWIHWTSKELIARERDFALSSQRLLSEIRGD